MKEPLLREQFDVCGTCGLKLPPGSTCPKCSRASREQEFISEATDLELATRETVEKIVNGAGASVPRTTVDLMHAAFIAGVVWQQGREIERLAYLCAAGGQSMSEPILGDVKIVRDGPVMELWQWRLFGDPDHGGYWHRVAHVFHGDYAIAERFASMLNPRGRNWGAEVPALARRQAS